MTSRSARSMRRRARACRHISWKFWRKIDITIIFITQDLEEADLPRRPHSGAVGASGRSAGTDRSAGRASPHVTQCFSPEFIGTKARLEELILQSKSHDEEEEGSYSMVTRLTNVEDNVE